MTLLLSVAGCLVALLLGIYLITVLRDTRLKKVEHIERQRDSLIKEIDELETKRQALEIDNTVMLPKNTINALDMYEQSNIRVPADILEELARRTFLNEQEVMGFIENQRHYWKLENSKKVYKRM